MHRVSWPQLLRWNCRRKPSSPSELQLSGSVRRIKDNSTTTTIFRSNRNRKFRIVIFFKTVGRVYFILNTAVILVKNRLNTFYSADFILPVIFVSPDNTSTSYRSFKYDVSLGISHFYVSVPKDVVKQPSNWETGCIMTNVSHGNIVIQFVVMGKGWQTWLYNSKNRIYRWAWICQISASVPATRSFTTESYKVMSPI